MRSTNPASAKLYALTCWHIASEGSASGAIVEWCDDNLGLPPNVRLGKLDRSVRPDKPSANGVVRDVALIQLDQGFELSNRNRAGIAIKGVRTTAIAIGETVHAYGFGGQAAKLAIVTNPQASMKLTYPGLGDIMFRDAVLCGPCSQPRDSGSIAVDDHGRAIGMVVGGEVKTGKKAGWTLLVPMQALMDHFALKLYEDSGPGAQPLPSNVVGQMLPVAGDLKSAVDTLARTVWGEAEGEPPAGKIAVTNVIVNRVRAGKPNRFGATVEAVCTRNNGAVWQFSCWTAGSTRAAKCREITTQNAAFRECLDVARRAILGVLDDLTNGSDHYHATSVSPSWVSGRAPVLVVGRHLFYNSIP